MRKLYHLATFFFTAALVNAQIVVQANINDTAQEFVDNLSSTGINAFNAQFTEGFNYAGGYFSGNSNIGFESGIVLSTSGAPSVEPGSTTTGSGLPFNNDADALMLLDDISLAPDVLNFLIVLEFDFTTSSNEFFLDYVFASNEYSVNTCGDDVDVFGLLLSGPGISGPYSNGAKNIALVPQILDPTIASNTPVGINSINSGTQSFGDSLNCDIITTDWIDNSIFYVDNPAMETVNFPGFTIPLTATSIVTACDTFHMKIVIVDVGDNNNSSGVFFEEESFLSPIEIAYNLENTSVPLLEDFVYEGCDGAYLTIYRPDNAVGDIPITYGFLGTADHLVDYTVYPGPDDSPMIEAGMPSLTFEITPIQDWIAEENETILFRINSLSSGCVSTDALEVQFTLADQPILDITITEDFTNYCPGDDAEMDVEISGGVGSLFQQPTLVEPYSIEWSQIGTAPEQLETPLVTTEYCVEVTDFCETQVLVECVTVSVLQYPELEAEAELINICSDVAQEICVEVEGGEGNYDFAWSNGSNDSCIYDFHNIYTVTVSDGCDEEVLVNTEIYLDEAPEPFFEYLDVPHLNQGIEFNNYTPFMEGLSFFWTFDDGYYSLLENPVHSFDEAQTYGVNLGVTTEIAGCYKEYKEYISVKPSYYFYAPNAFTPNKDSKNDTFKAHVTGAADFEIIIFDKFGKQVYFSNNSDEVWNGSYDSSTDAPQGMYSYKAKMKKVNEKGYYLETGSINLIR